MREFQDKGKFKKIIYSRIFQTVFALVVLFLVFSTVKSYKKSKISANKAEETRKEVSVLEKRNAELAKDVANLESDSGKEREIKKRFDIARPGEKILIIVDKNGEDVKINNAGAKISFFSKVWLRFKDLF